MKTYSNAKTVIIVLCLCGLLCCAIFIPDFFNYDIGYKNAQLEQKITDSRIEESLANTEFNLPIVYIKCSDIGSLTDSSLVPRPEITADIYVLDRDINKLTDIPTHIYKNITLTLRGNSSAIHQQKKSFNLEFSNPDGSSLNMPFLDFEAESDFVLLAPYIDRSLIRNYLGYELQRLAQDWGPESQFVEVFLDTPGTELGFSDYVGVYMVTEKFKKGVNRINIHNFTAADNPENQFEQGGGYIYKLDWYDETLDNVTRLEKNKFGNEYSIVYPKPADITDEQIQLIYNDIELFEEALYNGSDEDLEKYFDLELLARNMLISEFLKNHEAYSASTFFYRDIGGKVKVVQWDYDLGTGNMNPYTDRPTPENFWVLNYWPYPYDFLKHENFQQIMLEQWSILRQGILSDENIVKMLDELEKELYDAGLRNDAAYPDAFSSNMFAIYDSGVQSSREERKWIKEFLIERGHWLDEHIDEIKNLDRSMYE